MSVVIIENEQDVESIKLAVDRMLFLGDRDEQTVRLVATAARVLLESRDENAADAEEMEELKGSVEDLESEVYDAERDRDDALEEADALRKQLLALGVTPCR